jgi:hypothetical protein
MMHEAYYFSINTLPESVKQAVSAKLKLAQVSDQHRAEFDNIIKFMNGGASLDGFILRMRIADLDRKRQQNLVDVESELAELINYKYNE